MQNENQPLDVARRSTSGSDALEYRTCCEHPDCATCAGRGGFYRQRASRSDGTAAAGAESVTEDIEQRTERIRLAHANPIGRSRTHLIRDVSHLLAHIALMRSRAAATSGSELAGGSVLDIAARIFDFKPHKQTEEVKAKYLRFANEVIAQQAGAPESPTDEQIIAALHANGIDTYPSKYGFDAVQVSATSMPTLRKVIERFAAPAPAAEEVRWSKESPTEQADYWHWDGNEDHAPMIYHVMWSGTAKKCFVSIGQYGIDEAIWCDNFGGYWMKIEQPSVRAAMSASQGKNGEAK